MSILWIWNDLDPNMCPFVPWMFLILMMFGCLALWEIAGMESHLIAVLCCALIRGSVDLGLSEGLQAATEASRGVGGSGWIGGGLPRFALRPDENPYPKYISHHVA